MPHPVAVTAASGDLMASLQQQSDRQAQRPRGGPPPRGGNHRERLQLLLRAVKIQIYPPEAVLDYVPERLRFRVELIQPDIQDGCGYGMPDVGTPFP
jgi:hypothetical protein